jgi:hypothetical protein
MGSPPVVDGIVHDMTHSLCVKTVVGGTRMFPGSIAGASTKISDAVVFPCDAVVPISFLGRTYTR